MKTYSEKKGAKPFNWFEVLDKLIKGEAISPLKPSTLTRKVKSWTTCACGNVCAIIPRDYDGEPLDPKLSNLGIEFYERIECKEWAKAKEILEKIEVRSAVLIKLEVNKRKREIAKKQAVLQKEMEELSLAI